MLTFSGRWQLSVIGSDAMYRQRIVISGGINRIIPGVVGQNEVIDGDTWQLSVEHHDGTRWKRNVRLFPHPAFRTHEDKVQIIKAKDSHEFDSDPNDLVVRLDKLDTPADESSSVSDSVRCGK